MVNAAKKEREDMSNRGTDYQRMRPGESKKCMAAVASRRDTEGSKKAQHLRKTTKK